MEKQFNRMPVTTVDQEILPKLKELTPEHPALNRMRARMMQSSGVQAITAYDRMHHRHNRS